MKADAHSSRSRPWARRHFVCAAAAALLLAACPKQDPLPALAKIPAFALTDQTGKAVSQDALHGKIWIAAFMFTRCPTICPRITRRMQALQLETKKRNLGVE